MVNNYQKELSGLSINVIMRIFTLLINRDNNQS